MRERERRNEKRAALASITSSYEPQVYAGAYIIHSRENRRCTF